MKDEELREMAGLCAKCGTCRSVCSLYPYRKTENAVARGKVRILESALDGENRDLSAVQEAIADCLLCGRCARECPNQVQYEELMMRARARLADKVGGLAWKRILFGKILPSVVAMKAMRKAGALAQRLFLSKLPTGSGLYYRFPVELIGSGRTLPVLPSKGFIESLARSQAVSGDVMLFAGCVFNHIYPEICGAAYETMKVCGRPVSVFRDAACCGLPALVSGDRKSAIVNIEMNLKKMRAASPETIVFPCGSCLLMFKRNITTMFKEGDPLYEDAVFVAERAVDYAGFLLDSGIAGQLPDPEASFQGEGETGYHDSCHLTGTLGKGEAPRKVLARVVGKAFKEMEGAGLCCGLGGTFNIRDYPTSARIGENKICVAAKGGTKTIAAACSGCVLQLRDMAARVDPSMKVVHIAELVRHSLFKDNKQGSL
ncbi:MAG: (Fe-S)-binding protein [Syntrophorhabdaceae bacterium]|nr:(Fe-S)-binding protein [Syntrophorhabdaceae bacterium]